MSVIDIVKFLNTCGYYTTYFSCGYIGEEFTDDYTLSNGKIELYIDSSKKILIKNRNDGQKYTIDNILDDNNFRIILKLLDIEYIDKNPFIKAGYTIEHYTTVPNAYKYKKDLVQIIIDNDKNELTVKLEPIKMKNINSIDFDKLINNINNLIGK